MKPKHTPIKTEGEKQNCNCGIYSSKRVHSKEVCLPVAPSQDKCRCDNCSHKCCDKPKVKETDLIYDKLDCEHYAEIRLADYKKELRGKIERIKRQYIHFSKAERQFVHGALNEVLEEIG